MTDDGRRIATCLSSVVRRLSSDTAQRARRIGEIARQVLAGDVAVIDRLDRPAVIFLDAAAFLDPCDARALQAALDVNRDIVVGVRPGRIVDPYRLLTGTFRK